MGNRKTQMAFEFLSIFVFIIIIVTTLIVISGKVVIDLRDNEARKISDDFADRVLIEFEILQEVDEGYSRQIVIPSSYTESFNLSINGSYLSFEYFHYARDRADVYYYVIPDNIRVNFSERASGDVEINFSKPHKNRFEGISLEPINDLGFKNAFISVWRTSAVSSGSSGSNQVIFPLESYGIYNFTVDWGDGTNDTITRWDQPEVNHTYGTSGVYRIIINGEIEGFRFDGSGDRNKIIDIINWGSLRLGNNGGYFWGCSNLDVSATDVLNLSGVTDMSGMFRDAHSFNGDLSSWDVSSVTDMSGMFRDAHSFNGDLSSWNVSSVTDMKGMFQDAYSFNGNLSSWDVSGVNFCSDFNLNTTAWSTSNQPSFSLCTP